MNNPDTHQGFIKDTFKEQRSKSDYLCCKCKIERPTSGIPHKQTKLARKSCFGGNVV